MDSLYAAISIAPLAPFAANQRVHPHLCSQPPARAPEARRAADST